MQDIQDKSSFKDKIKTLIFLNGVSEWRKETVLSFEQVAPEETESLQFGFFLKTYAAIITNLSEDEINDHKDGDLEFDSKDILHRIFECVVDTGTRLDIKDIQYNKMAMLHIVNLFTNKSYRLEHELPEKLFINTKYLLRQIGEVWKQVFDHHIWSKLVLTAIKRSEKNIIILDDFRFPEEYFYLMDISIHDCIAIRILDDINKICIDPNEQHHISEYALKDFEFDYLLNCTIPYKEFNLNNSLIGQVKTIHEIITKDTKDTNNANNNE